MADITKEYTNGEITVLWKPTVCIHSAICFRGLPSVFHPKEKPWVKIEGAPSEEIKSQIDKCPSGALSYFSNS
ncbi:(4Fe-4S)-binding protein [Leptospira sarikeiensis]|uniref:(4Fe-4S)-binding protein n=1 Tax=Leptospira sarikeiensis TaxID=2484943 RepID=A0A4R9K151_9LEPT|nr:(4Fe-4S)-binding protein [Leptospira sarikeiensis]TGL58442.1 (4Fe-4S)-binding protein [Leptospira sarikeiensis]